MTPTRLQLAFEQTPRTSVKLSGTLQAKGVQMQDTGKQDLPAFDTLTLALDELRPLEQSVKLSLVELNAPKLNGGLVNFSGETTQPSAKLALQDMQLDAEGLAWPFAKPVQFKGSAQIASAASPVVTPASLKFDGNATDQVVKALLDRPALTTTVVGSSSLDEEREGYKRERLKTLLQAENRRAQVVGGAARHGGKRLPCQQATAGGASVPRQCKSSRLGRQATGR